MKKPSLFLTIALVSLATGVAQAKGKADCSDESHYAMISKSELKNVADTKKAFIIDVNSKESYDKVHVPGAVHFGSNEKDFASMLPKDKNHLVVAYCGGVKCSAWKKAAEVACNAGYANVQHFKEG